MNKLACCAALMVFGAGLDAEITKDEIYVWKPTRYKILNKQDELKTDFEILLLEFAKNHTQGYKINIVFSSNDCIICDRVLGVLMEASTQPVLSLNNIGSNNYSVIDEITGVIPQVGYFKFIILLTENVQEFFHHFAKLRLKYAWNPRAQHLIFMVKKPDDKELEMIFKECWSRKVLNIAVIMYNRKEAYTYNPYLKNHLEMREKVDWSRLFYEKLRNMNGYLIRTKYIPFSSTNVAKWIEEKGRFKIFGSDYGIAETFLKNVNATPGFINLTNDKVPHYRNFSYRYGLWKERNFRKVDLWLNSMPTEVMFHERSEKSYPVAIDNLRILAPKSGLRTPSIFEPYNNITWTCVVLSLIIVALYSHVFYKSRGIVDNAFLRTLGVFLGKNLAKRRHEFAEKFTFLVFTLCSLLILSAYQGELYGALATVSYYPEINTLSVLYQRIKTIHTYQIIAEYLSRYVPPGVKVIPFGIGDFVDLMKTHRDEAYAFTDSVAGYTVNWKVLSENGIPLYHLVNEYAVAGFRGYILPYGSPYLDRLDRIVLACKEAGLDEYWQREAIVHAILSGTIISNHPEERKLKKLSLQTQLYGFYIWGIGLVISSLCWAGEIYFHKYGNKIRHETKVIPFND